MKKPLLFRSIATMVIAFMGIGLFAQATDIILDPAQLIPADTGYYIGGVWKDKNSDGVDEFYNQCLDEYGDASHNEDGEQFGFTYNDCMIMPTCWPKNAVDDHSLAEIDHPEGYIELTKSRYYGTDSARLGYIISPVIENLESLTLETSPDVSSNDQRRIKFWLEYSKDFGETWEVSFIEDETVSKAGESRTYDGSVYLEFGDMKTASTQGPIVLRIMSKPEQEGYSSQRVKVHWLKIVAEYSTYAVKSTYLNNPGNLKVYKGTISSPNEVINVFDITGKRIGFGESVHVDNSGIYIVKTHSGNVHKLYVNNY